MEEHRTRERVPSLPFVQSAATQICHRHLAQLRRHGIANARRNAVKGDKPKWTRLPQDPFARPQLEPDR